MADGFAYGAAGSRGVHVYDVSDPLSQSGWLRWSQGGIISVALADVLWTATRWAWPPSMCAIRSRRSLWAQGQDSWAMAVAASDSGAFLAGWNEVAVYQADLAQIAPDAQPDLSALYRRHRAAGADAAQ